MYFCTVSHANTNDVAQQGYSIIRPHTRYLLHIVVYQHAQHIAALCIRREGGILLDSSRAFNHLSGRTITSILWRYYGFPLHVSGYKFAGELPDVEKWETIPTWYIRVGPGYRSSCFLTRQQLMRGTLYQVPCPSLFFSEPLEDVGSCARCIRPKKNLSGS